MRVLHVGKFFPPCPGGIEYVLHDLLPAQRSAGLEVGAVVHHHERGAPTVREDFRGSPLWRVRTFGTLLYAPVSPEFPFALRKAIKTFKPDLLHLHVPNTSAFLTPDLPCVVHWHSDVVASKIDKRLAWGYHLYRPFERRLLDKARAVITTSQPYLDTSETLKPYRGKCHVVALGIDPSRLPDPDETSLHWARRQWPADTLRVLAIGRLSYYKGHEYLLEALADAPDLSLCLVGKGDLSLKLDEQIIRLGLSSRVNMLGYASDMQVRALLAECDCMALPSVERTEAFGIVQLEAMRYGKPLVTADIPGSGVGFVAQHENNAPLVPPGNVDALREALQRLRADAQMRKELGGRGAARFTESFHIDRMAEGLSAIYDQVAG